MAARLDLMAARSTAVLFPYSYSPARTSLASCASSMNRSLRARGDVVVSLMVVPPDDIRVKRPPICHPALWTSSFATSSGPFADPQVGMGRPLITAFHALDSVDSGRQPLYFLAAFHTSVASRIITATLG